MDSYVSKENLKQYSSLIKQKIKNNTDKIEEVENELEEHVGNNEIHVTPEEKEKWNNIDVPEITAEQIQNDEYKIEVNQSGEIPPEIIGFKVTKIRLSDGKVYAIKDSDSLHFDPVTGKILTGNVIVDNIIIQENKFILQIGDLDLTSENLLSINRATGQIYARDAKKVLQDIGGISYSLDDNTGTLSFRFGAQES